MSTRRVSAVVDTNLFIGALISARGASGTPYAAWREGAFILHISDEQRAEIVDVLSRPKFTERFKVSTAAVQGLLYLLETRALRAPLLDPLPLQVRDPKDYHILAAALGGGADYLVSGDADLLSLADDPRLVPLRITTVQAFLTLLPE